jgi:hypothetical protein
MPPEHPGYDHHYPPSRGYVSMILVGIIILMVGGIIAVSAGFMDDPDNGGDREEYYDNLRTITTLGKLVQYIGLIIFSIGMVQGAITDNRIPINVRMGLLIAMGIIVGFSLSSVYLSYIGI